nr:PREDICTED: 26S proteasome non-ATPase regulatory subunit 9 [Bemisia tabaci]
MVILNTMEKDLRQNVLRLMAEKEKIETTIREMFQILETNRVTMNDPLVDNEGFPRQDIDVFQVRHARHQIICLQNDFKNVMKNIEEGLHRIHAKSNPDSSAMESTSSVAPQDLPKPFASINFVAINSPADEAGLKVNDSLVQFGTVHSNNIRNLTDIHEVVKHSIGQSINVTALRNQKIIHLTLRPHTWAGRGVLGCEILPVDFVDR